MGATTFNHLMALAMASNVSTNPFGPDTRTAAEVANQAENLRPDNERRRSINRRRGAIRAKKAAKQARNVQRRRK